MIKPLVENRVFALMLVASALLNLGLGYKLQQVRHDLLSLEELSSHPYVLGAVVSEILATDLDGKTKAISFSKNDPPTILYIFRPGCGWCAKNEPNLQAIAAATSAGNFHLIGISLDDHGLKQYVENEHYTFPVFSNVSSDERARLGMGETPQTLMIENGAVVHNWEGAYSPRLQREIESALRIKLPGVVLPATIIDK